MTRKKPATFIMHNSKGFPDFIMTMLVYFSITLFVLLLVWILTQYFGFRVTSNMSAADKEHPFLMFLQSFNDTIRMIVIAVSGSVFALAGSYLLRRKFHDDHYLNKLKFESDTQKHAPITHGTLGFEQSSISHPNFDDEEEDI